MASLKLFQRTQRSLLTTTTTTSTRPFSSTPLRPYASEASPSSSNPFAQLNTRVQDTAAKYREFQLSKPLNPHMTNTTSTIANSFPSVGSDKPPPELVSAADGGFVTEDSVPENTQRMTGGTQGAGGKAEGAAEKKVEGELEVGEIEGGKFKVEPLRREGEDLNTLRARLTYQSRKRGTLESDLLLSTFANAHLGSMTARQLHAYDIFLDENDWDIYYWTTQEPTPTSHETAEGSSSKFATPAAQGKDRGSKEMPGNDVKEPQLETDDWRQGRARSGEWAQTVGAFKPAYRPVPARWKNSEILSMLRKHVIDHSAGGVLLDEEPAKVEEKEKSLTQGALKGSRGGGLGMMPELRSFRQ